MIKKFDNGLLSSNVYLVYSKNQGMIVDCGALVDPVSKFAKENNIEVKYIVLTHGHYDHVNYIGDYARAFDGATVICHEDEVATLCDSEANVSVLFGAECVYNHDYTTVREGDTLSVGTLNFKIMHTPGHTPGGICLYEEKVGVLFTGDTLFHQGYGRTDFKGGDWHLLVKSLKRLLALDGETRFFSGHGDSAKIKDE
jgi:glyoxylase-like metal-dependent hydrolase (beta-lactamase superfamily II)